MKTPKKTEKKPSKVKEIYDQMQAEKNAAGEHKVPQGKHGKGPKGGKFNSQARKVEKKYWRQ
jgi:hypothetical protein